MCRISVPDLSQLLFVVDEHGFEVRCRFELGEFRNSQNFRSASLYSTVHLGEVKKRVWSHQEPINFLYRKACRVDDAKS